MGKREELPKRKKNRLENYDYGSCGAYFVTICTVKRQNYFWKSDAVIETTNDYENVGATIGRPQCDYPQNMELSQYGGIVNEAINNIPIVYPSLSVDGYVIMPNHVHLLLRIDYDKSIQMASGRPMTAPTTISRVINNLKGYISKQAGFAIWQKSFHDHIVRNQEDYEAHMKYISENPSRWIYDELYISIL